MEVLCERLFSFLLTSGYTLKHLRIEVCFFDDALNFSVSALTRPKLKQMSIIISVV